MRCVGLHVSVMYPINLLAGSAQPYYVGAQPVVYTLVCFVQ